MKRWQWTLLIFELVLIALILVLPQVDLPDFTFHGGVRILAFLCCAFSFAELPLILPAGGFRVI